MAIKTWKDEKYKVEEAENTSLVLFKRVPNTNKSYMSLEMARELILEGIWCEGGV